MAEALFLQLMLFCFQALYLKMVKLEFVRAFWFHIWGQYQLKFKSHACCFFPPEGPCFLFRMGSAIGEGVWQRQTQAPSLGACLAFSNVLATQSLCGFAMDGHGCLHPNH